MSEDTEGQRMLVVTSACRIPHAELTWLVGPSGGPGGQHANRAHTRVEVRFDAAASPSLDEAQRRRIVERLGPVVSATSERERSQSRNRRAAVDTLRRRLEDALYVPRRRKATRPSRGAVERRLESKRQRSDRKAQRRRPGYEE